MLVPSLFGGATVLLSRDAHGSADEIVAAIVRHGVTILRTVPTLLTAIAEGPGFGPCRETLRLIISAGEVLRPELVTTIYEQCAATVENAYGPTETTFVTMFHRCERDRAPQASLPLGEPIANTSVHILDANLEPVPIGVVGEVHIGGAGVGLGYWRRPDLTEHAFVMDPFGRPGDRMYRTGDRARRRADGTVEFVGRRDHQVKIRGYRIELGDIQAGIVSCPGVRAAVVDVRPDARGEAQLVAWAVLDGNSEFPAANVARIRNHVAEKLPSYMHPASIMIVDAVPLRANGKVDVSALPNPVSTSDDRRSHIAPRDPLERLLCRVWGELLDRTDIGIDDNFFEIGGHSLLAAALLARLDEELPTPMRLSVMVDAPTVRALAERYRSQREQDGSAVVVTMNRGGGLPPMVGVPGVYGSALGYTSLARALGAEQPVYAMHAVGLDGETPPSTVEAIARRYVEEVRRLKPTGPYLIVGACFGATVAYEMARQLLAVGAEVALLGLIDPSVRGGDADAPNGERRHVHRADAVRSFVGGRLKLYASDMAALGRYDRMRYVARKAVSVARGIARGPSVSGARREINDISVYSANIYAADRYARPPLPVAPRRVVIFESSASTRVRSKVIDWKALCGVPPVRVWIDSRDSGDMLSSQHAPMLAAALRLQLHASLIVAP
jgi:hypothetical protein